MKLLFVADPLETFKIYKDTTFAMMREAAARGHELLACEPRDLVWQTRRPGQRARARDHARRAEQRTPGSVESAAPASLALAELRRGAHAQGPAVRQRVLLRHAPARAGRARGRARLQQAARRCATIRKSSRSSSSRSSSRRRSSRATRRRCKRFHAEHQRHHPEAARRHGRHGHLPRRAGRPEPRQHHRDAQHERRRDGDGAALPARDRAPATSASWSSTASRCRIALARIPQGSEIRGNLAAGGKGVAQPLIGARPRDRRGDRPGARARAACC